MTAPPPVQATAGGPRPPAGGRSGRARRDRLARRWWAWAALGLGLAVALAYAQALGLGFLSDDWVLLNLARGWRPDLSLFAVDPAWVFHRPLGRLAWLALGRLAGPWPPAYHALSLALHWANSLLVMALVLRLCPGARRPALAAGLVFALLPLQVEAVAWASSLYDLGGVAFYLAALLLLASYWRTGRAWRLLAALLAYQLCLWSKELAFTWPLAALVLAGAAAARPSRRALLISLPPFALLLGLNVAQRLLAWGDLGGYRSASRDYAGHGWDWLSSVPASLLAPLSRTLLPEPLVQLWWLIGAGLVLLGLLGLRRRRLFAAGVAWMAVTALPVLNLLPIGPGLEAARLLYLPAVGGAMALAALLEGVAALAARAWPRLGRRRAFQALLAGLALVYLAVLQLHFGPWRVASRVSEALPAALHRLLPRFGPDTVLEVVGLPLGYRGAELFNLGFDHAFQQRFGAWFTLQAAAADQPLALDGRDRFRLLLREDVAAADWRVAGLSGVLRPTADVGATGRVLGAWGPEDCRGWSDWTVVGAETACEPGAGLAVRPAGEDAQLLSPALAAPPGQWLRLAVDLAPAGPDPAGAAVQLYWHSPADWFDEARSLRLPLAPGDETRRYVWIIPPPAGGAVNQLRLDPVDQARPMRVERVELRAIPP